MSINQDTTGPNTAAIRDIIHAIMDAMRSQLAAMDSPLGLYAAISALPERPFEAVILRYILGYSLEDVGSIMGINITTVRHHCRDARRRISVEIGSLCSEQENCRANMRLSRAA
ncbi:RNA polymerase sigma factor [Streptomyces sp. NPDC059680]|uniref:RNA polymerase sigma factor n=1 Tax=Streptomyces sp. NPDC059680 TaxID=3346904 RepID=UPI0036D1B223